MGYTEKYKPEGTSGAWQVSKEARLVVRKPLTDAYHLITVRA